MGHIRLGRLPATKPWKKVVELLRTNSDMGVLAMLPPMPRRMKCTPPRATQPLPTLSGS